MQEISVRQIGLYTAMPMLLTLLAEAIVREGNTVTTEAINLLNQVRTRAGLTAYTDFFFQQCS